MPTGLPLAALFSLLYTGAMALVWLATGYVYDEPSAADERALTFALLPLLALTALVCRLTRLPDPRTPPRWGLAAIGVLGLLTPVWGLIPVAWVVFREGSPYASMPVAWGHLGWSLTACLLVGVVEELAYRGVVLGALLRKREVAPSAAIGSVLFALLHLSNVFAGRSFDSVVVQVGITLVTGWVFTWTYLLSGKNLPLVMLVHGLYDFGFSAAAASPFGENPFTFLNMGVVAALALGLGVVGSRSVRARNP